MVSLQGSWYVDAETKSHKLSGTWTFGSEEPASGEYFTLVCNKSENPQAATDDNWRGGIFEGFFMQDGKGIDEKDVRINFDFDHTSEAYILSGYGRNKYGAFQLNGKAKSNIFEPEGQYTVKMEKIYLNEEDTGDDDKKKSKRERKTKKRSGTVKNKNRRSKRKKTPTAKAASLKTPVAARNDSSSHIKESRSFQSHNVAPIKTEDQHDIIEIPDDEDVVVKCEEQDGNTMMIVEEWLQDKIPFFHSMKHRIEKRAYAEKLIKSGYDTIEALEDYLDEKILNELKFKPAHRQALLKNTSQE